MLCPFIRTQIREKLKKRTKYVFIFIILAGLSNYFGIFIHIFEKDYYKNFDYPLNIDIMPLIEQLRNNEIPSVPPINTYNYTFLKSCEEKCKGSTSLELVIIIKSAMSNSERRQAIRNTFGNENRFSNIVMKTVFLLGVKDSDNNYELQKSINRESENFGDIIQANFIDNYFNNTIKTMMGLKWAVKFCSSARFYYFSDDDMYVSIKNLINFMNNPLYYPENIIESKIITDKKILLKRSISDQKSMLSIETEKSSKFLFTNSSHKLQSLINLKNRNKRDIRNYNTISGDDILFAGFVYTNSPYRNKNSKWYVSLNEYAWHKWPPFVPAGAYILSKKALTTLYYGSFYTAHFRFDDIYLAIIARKCGIIPFNCKEFHNYKKKYSPYDYRYVIASHGYSDPKELSIVWNEQKSLGYA